MRILILDEAERDLEEGRQFYEAQREGLGAYFLDTLFSDIGSLQLYAGLHRLFFGQYHRLLSKRFPFAVYLHPFRGHRVHSCRARLPAPPVVDSEKAGMNRARPDVGTAGQTSRRKSASFTLWPFDAAAWYAGWVTGEIDFNAGERIEG